MGTVLPAGHRIRVQLSGLPVSFMAYARWIALAVLIGAAIFVTAWVAFRPSQSVPADTVGTARDDKTRRRKRAA